MGEQGEAMLTKEEVAEFKRLVLEIYGVVLTDEEALDQGARLIQLIEQLMRYSPQLAFKAIDLNDKKEENG